MRKLQQTSSIRKRGPRTQEIIDEICMVLMRHCLGVLIGDSTVRFCIYLTACIHTINHGMTIQMYKLKFLVQRPSKSAVQENMSKLFRIKFPDTQVVTDYTEIRVEYPSSTQLKINLTVIINLTTLQVIDKDQSIGTCHLFVGPLERALSNKQINKKCGLLKLLETGDTIMADKRFSISDLTTPLGVQLILLFFQEGKYEVHMSRMSKYLKNCKCQNLCRIHYYLIEFD